MGRSQPLSTAGRRSFAAGVVAAIALAAAAGCGVAAQDRPQAVSPSPSWAPAPAPPHVTGVVQVYLVRGGHLVPVPRTGRTVAEALAALSTGPTALDLDAGLGSTLPDLALEVRPAQDPDLVTVAVPAQFANLPMEEQFLAVGQIVWTATAPCCATRVQVLLSERPLRVPIDGGTATRPLLRSDYLSIAPL